MRDEVLLSDRALFGWACLLSSRTSSQGSSCRIQTALWVSRGWERRTPGFTPAPPATSVAASTPQPPSGSLVRGPRVAHTRSPTYIQKHTWIHSHTLTSNTLFWVHSRLNSELPSSASSHVMKCVGLEFSHWPCARFTAAAVLELSLFAALLNKIKTTDCWDLSYAERIYWIFCKCSHL